MQSNKYQEGPVITPISSFGIFDSVSEQQFQSFKESVEEVLVEEPRIIVKDRDDNLTKFLLSVVLGAGTGLCVSLFKLGVANVQSLSYDEGLANIFIQASQVFSGTVLNNYELDGVPPGFGSFMIALVPAFGGLTVTLLRVMAGGGDPGRGLKDLAANDGEQPSPSSLRPQLSRALQSVVTLGTGNSLGPEGPSVDIGAFLARCLTMQWQIGSAPATKYLPGGVVANRSRNLFLGAGAAAGVAAGFNAPIAAVFFAIEIVQPLQHSRPQLSSFSPSALGAMREEEPLSSRGNIAFVLLSSAIASLTARELLAERLAFKVADYSLESPVVELPLYLGLGLVSGLIAFAFKRVSAYFAAVFSPIDAETDTSTLPPGWPLSLVMNQVPGALQPALAGLICGVVGLFFPQVLFFGYATLDSILADSSTFTFNALLELCGLKLILTALCGASGLVGGTFAPALFLGATAGAAYQQVVAALVGAAAQMLVTLQTSLGVVPGTWGVLPQLQVANAPAYAMVGAASVLAGLFNAPLTSSLLLFELTRDFDIVLPLITAAGLSSLINPPTKNPGPDQDTIVVSNRGQQSRDLVAVDALSFRGDLLPLLHQKMSIATAAQVLLQTGAPVALIVPKERRRDDSGDCASSPLTMQPLLGVVLATDITALYGDYLPKVDGGAQSEGASAAMRSKVECISEALGVVDEDVPLALILDYFSRNSNETSLIVISSYSATINATNGAAPRGNMFRMRGLITRESAFQAQRLGRVASNPGLTLPSPSSEE